MTLPKAATAGQNGSADATLVTESLCALETLRKRSDFLTTSKGRRQGGAGFNVQARKRTPDQADPAIIRVGFTCSKKVGNAVARNRAKRRLRDLARKVLPLAGRAGWDYVLVGRANVTASRPFGDLLDDLTKALIKIHSKRPAP